MVSFCAQGFDTAHLKWNNFLVHCCICLQATGGGAGKRVVSVALVGFTTEVQQPKTRFSAVRMCEGHAFKGSVMPEILAADRYYDKFNPRP